MGHLRGVGRRRARCCCAGSCGRLAAACSRCDVDLPVDRQRLLHDADERGRDGEEPIRLELRARLDDGQRRQHPGRAGEHGQRVVPGHERRPRQHRLVEHAAAARVPRPVRVALAVRQQPCQHVLQRHLGRARTGARGAAPARPELDARPAVRKTTSRARTTTKARSRSPFPLSRCRSPRRRSARRSRRPARSATRTAAACARRGGSTASGPVKVVFQHSGGTGAPVTTAVLQSTNQTAAAAAAGRRSTSR